MEQVAHHLQKAAVARRSTPEDFDQFGRSAFNRYYYATFLSVRTLIKEFEPDWAGGHATVPDMLNGSISKEINNFRKAAQRRSEQEAVGICNRALSAAAGLAQMMKTANAVRVTADYNPDIKIKDEKTDRFSLGPTNITDAHAWIDQAKVWIPTIRRAWRMTRDLL